MGLHTSKIAISDRACHSACAKSILPVSRTRGLRVVEVILFEVNWAKTGCNCRKRARIRGWVGCNVFVGAFFTAEDSSPGRALRNSRNGIGEG